MAKVVGSSTKRTGKASGRGKVPDVGQTMKRAEQRLARLVDDLGSPEHATPAPDAAKVARKMALRYAAERAAAKRAVVTPAVPAAGSAGKTAAATSRKAPSAAKSGKGKAAGAAARSRRASVPRKPSGR
jgi:hypothetical protein